jgi:hypothetical protein
MEEVEPPNCRATSAKETDVVGYQRPGVYFVDLGDVVD